MDDAHECGIPDIIHDCTYQIRMRGLLEVGILRASGSNSHIKEIQSMYRKGKPVDLSEVYIHTVSGVLKNYLRDMSIPLLTFEKYDSFLALAGEEDENVKVDKLRGLIEQLPLTNQEILHKLFVLIREVGESSEINKMTSTNLATMFAPIWFKKKDQERAAFLLDLDDLIEITNLLITKNILENWPDEQDIHPSKVEKQMENHVHQAVSNWYGKNKNKRSTRATSLTLPKAMNLNKGGKKEKGLPLFRDDSLVDLSRESEEALLASSVGSAPVSCSSEVNFSSWIRGDRLLSPNPRTRILSARGTKKDGEKKEEESEKEKNRKEIQNGKKSEVADRDEDDDDD
eukprot:CAMPEP_0201476076 /NCGR_PEP_ID=MMETSP0151_2-20130828/1371_1 /ASSEMBLY_ACC=CAM_ASM_000257 /TAXON_ID=200890 /ORGANISM="Paramoeba atlantica, Strain 621/1 / CCAP 1560/9" /LENGTH=342 /DNA_ID=CAMNT_0047856355 /DNA_START=89 /DNA_END=1114 /DNA_ORIENTATION=-